MDTKLLKYFKYKHLPEHLQVMSKPFSTLAHQIAIDAHTNNLDDDEAEMALRKLLEAKDCAVRAKVK